MSNENQKSISDLRELLFQTIEGVKAGTVDIERAKAISELSQVVVNSAKAETDFVRATGAKGSGFLEQAPTKPLPPGIVGVTTHRLQG